MLQAADNPCPITDCKECIRIFKCIHVAKLDDILHAEIVFFILWLWLYVYNKLCGVESFRIWVHQLDRKLSTFYETQRFITVFTTGHHWTASWASRIQSTASQLTSLRYILISSIYAFWNGFFFRFWWIKYLRTSNEKFSIWCTYKKKKERKIIVWLECIISSFAWYVWK